MTEILNLADYPWRHSYRTSQLRADGKPVDILREFYIPLLERALRYDRVVGYFRSSSLALASRGLSAFVRRQGQARMIVGADLDPRDVQAILNGQARLDAALNAELDDPERWPMQALRGVELLSWMVRHECLEIRVAIRVHAGNGKPITLDSNEDGYVHEKWALAYDASGHCLYASGSWNESMTALQRNAENIDLDGSWEGEKERAIIADAKKDFAALWNDAHPAFRVLALPDAVRLKLLKFSEQLTIPVELDERSETPRVPNMPLIEQARFWLIRVAPKMPGGVFVGMQSAPIEPWPHQSVAARRLIAAYPASFLLCDEVGLGKTIEAGLALRSLYLSGRARRILIATPASLAQQWQREMASKFFLPFARVKSGPVLQHERLLPSETTVPAENLYSADLTILSTGLMTRPERRGALDHADCFDIALVDEAHYARRSNSQRGARGFPKFNNLYKTLAEPLRSKTKCLLLATATPMQLDPVEALDLIALCDRAGAFQFDPSLTLQIYRLIAKVASNEGLSCDEWRLLRAAVCSIEGLDPLLWRYLDKHVVDPLSRLSIDQWLKREIEPPPLDRSALARLLFAAAPLSRVMLRHTRDLLKIYHREKKLGSKLAERQIIRLPRIVFTPQEAQVDRLLQEYCEGLREQLLANGKNGANQTAIGFYLSFLRLRFASSLLALKLTLERRLEKVRQTLLAELSQSANSCDPDEMRDLLVEGGDSDQDAVEALLQNRSPGDLRWERDFLARLLHALEDLSQVSSKMRALLQVLERRKQSDGRIQQTVIFTRFFDTLCDIVGRVKAVQPDLLVGTYSGQGGVYFDPVKCAMVNVEREQIKHFFVQGRIDVLVCTDAAAEGLNLQSADLLINFDLPWNPMKVEQRIGRIDRIGQRHDRIEVLNLCYVDSAESIVYGRLMERLAQAGLVVGTQNYSILPVTVEEFQELAERRLSEQELEQRALERARTQRENNRLLEIPAEDLFRIHRRQEKEFAETTAPVTLDQIWSALVSSSFLADLGCAVSPCGRYMELRGIEGIGERICITVDRALFDRGLDGGRALHFATYGDDVFDRLLDYLCRQASSTAVKALSACSDGFEVAGIVVLSGNTGTGNAHTVMLSDYAQLDAMTLVDGSIDSDEIERFESKLRDYAASEALKIAKIKQLEKLNRDQAESQVKLNNLMLKMLLEAGLQRGRTKDLAGELLRDAETHLAKRESGIRLSSLNRSLKPILEGALLEVHWPANGPGRFDAPLSMLEASIDAGHRLLEKIKKQKSKISGTEIIGRLDRDLAQRG